MDTDFLVIGSGVAGLSYALRVAKFGKVVVVTKKAEVDTATNLAQGGIAAVLDPSDSIDEHVKDTLISGAGLCDVSIAELVVGAGASRVEDLVDIGVRFVKDEKDEGQFDLGREGGHSKRRVAHAYDLTGREIEMSLVARVDQNENIIVLENHIAVDLLMVKGEGGAENECAGAYVLDDTGNVEPYRARKTLLCTGGCGKVYLYTSNPDIATGDGVAMAMRAGAVVENMEFVQFHPTCLYHPKAKNFLISEAVRGEGGVLVDEAGKPFMEKYDSRKDLATRDAVARAIDTEMKTKGCDNVYLDITHKSYNFLHKRFPTIYTKCVEFGIDMSRDPIPVVPAAHYMCGGVKVDSWACSSVVGLMCLGETSSTGLHGGNRLASNSLLEAVVFAKRAADYCEKEWPEIKDKSLPDIDDWKAGEAEALDEEILINHNWDQIRRIMWNYVGIVRSERRLKLAKERMDQISKEIEDHYKNYFVTDNMVELRNIAFVAQAIIQSASFRKESRGLHFMRDYPKADESQKVTRSFKRNKKGVKWELEVCE